MDIDSKNKFGGVTISNEAIAQVSGRAASECYGVVGLAPRPSMASYIQGLLSEKDFSKGVYVSRVKTGYEVSVYLYLAHDVRLTEVVAEVQKKLKYVIERTFGIKMVAINVYVQDVKDI